MTRGERIGQLVLNRAVPSRLSCSVEWRPTLSNCDNVPEARGSNGFGSSNQRNALIAESNRALGVAIDNFMENSRGEFAKWTSRANRVSPQFFGHLCRLAFYKFSEDGINMVKNGRDSDMVWNSDEDHYLGVTAMSMFSSKYMSETKANTLAINWLNRIVCSENEDTYNMEMTIFRHRLLNILKGGMGNFSYSTPHEEPVYFKYNNIPDESRPPTPLPQFPTSTATDQNPSENEGRDETDNGGGSTQMMD